MNKSESWGQVLNWFIDLFVKHPFTFILTVPISAYLTYVIVKFINDDINARNKKLGMNPRNDTTEAGWLIISMVVALFAGLLFCIYSLINWIGSTLLAAPNF